VNVAGALMLLGALWATQEYRQVALIYQPGDSPLSLPERIAQGQRTWLFAHHADYAAATSPSPGSPTDWAAFASTTHALLDTRLMMAWAQALNEAGQVDKARYLAARLREFRNPAADDFFAACDEVVAAGTPLPFQCEAPRNPALTWRDFEP